MKMFVVPLYGSLPMAEQVRDKLVHVFFEVFVNLNKKTKFKYCEQMSKHPQLNSVKNELLTIFNKT